MRYNLTSITNALFTKSQQQVLGLLFGQPQKDFNTNEIIKLTNVGSGAVQRQLEKLVTSGLINVSSVSNQKRYQANSKNPIYQELVGIVTKTFGITDVITLAIKPLAHKIDFAFIYGSIAKHEETSSSDIDIMIISDEVTYGDFFKLVAESESTLGRKLNPTFYSKQEWINKFHAKNHFITSIMAKPKVFLVGSEHGLNKLNQLD